MGKGYQNYMSKKFFHPNSYDNIKRKWMAHQKKDFDDSKEQEKLVQYQREQEQLESRALLGDEKAKLGIAFLYDRPPGADKNEDNVEEKDVKFEWQRKFQAPRESYCKQDGEVRDQPFGIEVRNVRCVKCHNWGHVNTDRVCPLFGKSVTMEPELPKSHLGRAGHHMRSENSLQFTRRAESSGYNEVVAARSSGSTPDDPAEAFLRSLSDKQRKKLLKKLDRMEDKSPKKKKKQRHHDRHH